MLSLSHTHTTQRYNTHTYFEIIYTSSLSFSHTHDTQTKPRYLENIQPLIVVASDVESLPIGAEAEHIVGEVAAHGCGDGTGVQRQVHPTLVA